MSADNTSGATGRRSEAWYRRRAVVVGAVTIICTAAVLLLILGWGWLKTPQHNAETNSATLRNVGLLVAALVSGLLVSWRNLVAMREARAAQHQADVAERQAELAEQQAELTRRQTQLAFEQAEAASLQADSARAQAESTRQSTLDDRYRRSAEMLASHELMTRIGGIHALESLAREDPTGHLNQIVDLLCTFARKPPRDSDGDEIGSQRRQRDLEESPDEAAPFAQARADVVAAVQTAARCVEQSSEVLEDRVLRLELQGVELMQERLWDINLTGADLTEAVLAEARLDGANLADTALDLADLSGADLIQANLTRSRLVGVDLANATLVGANLSAAELGAEAAFHPGDAERNPTEPFLLHEGQLYCTARGLTQAQLDTAVADPESPPVLIQVLDAETGEPLVWRGGVPA